MQEQNTIRVDSLAQLRGAIELLRKVPNACRFDRMCAVKGHGRQVIFYSVVM